MTRNRFSRLRRDEQGATAIEYALTLPLLLTMLLGGIWVSMLMLAANSLNYTVQTAARCAAVNEKLCGDSASTLAYAAKLYAGPTTAPVFDVSDAGCGHTVTAETTFDMNIIPIVKAVPLKSSACYP